GHADLTGLARVDVTAGGADVEAVTLARIDARALFVELETLGPARVLVDPRILETLGGGPVEGAPDVEQERPVLGGEGGDAVRAQDPARQLVAHLHLVEVRGHPQ